jgi:hypothetical protein
MPCKYHLAKDSLGQPRAPSGSAHPAIAAQSPAICARGGWIDAVGELDELPTGLVDRDSIVLVQGQARGAHVGATTLARRWAVDEIIRSIDFSMPGGMRIQTVSQGL